MSSLAKYLLYSGKKVGGSDICPNMFTNELSELGVCIYPYETFQNIELYDLVVYTDAVKENDKSLVYARGLNKPVISRGQLLYEISREFNKVIAVSGCHGKTTCCSMLTHIFASAGKKFTSHIGGCDIEFSNFYSSGHDFFITEACEYKKNFLLLKPDIAVILNSSPDHLECYGSEKALKDAYKSFSGCADITVSLYCDMPFDLPITFGFDKNANYYAKNIRCVDGLYSFTVCESANVLGEISLNVYGKHNILNALAAIAAARVAGIPFRFIRDGLSDFSGVARRFEKIGYYNGAVCIADYAHHPDEIRATLRTSKKITEGKIFVVFQPHTYSRTRNLFKQFVKVLSGVGNLLIYRTYAAREYFDDSGSALTLANSVKKSRYGDTAQDIISFISRAEEGDAILFLGAGDIYDIANKIVKKQ